VLQALAKKKVVVMLVVPWCPRFLLNFKIYGRFVNFGNQTSLSLVFVGGNFHQHEKYFIHNVDDIEKLDQTSLTM
jgi:hypothetical protein